MSDEQPIYKPFSFAKGDPLAEEHVAVGAWVEEACTRWPNYWNFQLKSIESGQVLLSANGPEALRYVLTAIVQSKHWDQLVDRHRQRQGDGPLIQTPEWRSVWHRSIAVTEVIKTLMRRKLPFTEDSLLELLGWCNQVKWIIARFHPVTAIVKALERHIAEAPPSKELNAAMLQYANKLRGSHEKKVARMATQVEQLCVAEGPETQNEEQSLPLLPPPSPAFAGNPLVLLRLKRLVGMSVSSTDEADENRTTRTTGPDEFPLASDSPFIFEHELLTNFLEDVVGTREYHNPRLQSFDSGMALVSLAPENAGRALLAAAERHVYALSSPSIDYAQPGAWQSRYATAGIVRAMAQMNFSLSRDGVFDLLLYFSARPPQETQEHEMLFSNLLRLVESDARKEPLSEGERYVLSLFRASLVLGPLLGNSTPQVARLNLLIQDGVSFCLEPGEVWADAVNEDFSAMPPDERSQWAEMFGHLLTANSSRPSKKWLKTAAQLAEQIGSDKVHEHLKRWLPLVSQGRSIERLGSYAGDTRGAADTMKDENATCLRGMLWLIAHLDNAEQHVRAIGRVALSAYKKVPGVGPRAPKVGNAAVYALSEIPSPEAVGQLALLKVRVKFGTAQKEIEKAFNAAAEALGLARDEIEEIGVPTYGLEESGRCSESLGEYRAEITVSGSDAKLHWFDPKGKALKSVPAKVRKEHKEELKELKQSVSDIQRMLPAQRDRIDSMFLQQRSWSIEQWRERYLNHPLVGTIASRLLWCIDDTPVLFIDGNPTDVEGQPVEHGRTAEITLWHPVGRRVEEVVAWRQRIESLELTQPFKQAHREVYLLTDAERNTGTYSNRYAAHVLRQHQFNALCAARGWKNSLRLMVDADLPPACKELPNWGLRAEFWVEGIGEDYGTDTNESGVFLRLVTDQVRFYRSEAATNYAHASGGGYTSYARNAGQGDINNPLPLDEVPPLVFSEVMRDVDLFVGVSSVGNDPTWQDGGPEGRFRDYWQNYSFGELSGTASTRKEVLQRLIPRLKIAKQCSFSDRFLVVAGKKRTYKIHLGSGNILMEPNDQYLCIVPDAKARSKQDDLFLPFEGDNTLSIIISKAFLLAEDTKIKDPTITRQIDYA
ncbi:MAG: DUF4132 domain-containing protein [Planctomycetaceae bacterium]